jgi:UDP-N-acetylglucosamine diphosphorylase/glucosamine-1-phosphate N-acetyltransferase
MAAIVLAAGLGKRMQSDLPKVLHTARGRPLLRHVLDAVRGAGIGRVVVVIGHQAERVQEAMSDLGLEWALQEPQLGTAHAVQQAAPQLAQHEGDVLVLCGDTPLLRASTLQALCEEHRRRGVAATVLTAEVDDPTGYGRILRDARGDVLRIVEHKDAQAEERAVREINSGLYVFAAPDLFEALRSVDAENAQGEYYLTDTLEILRRAGKRVGAYRCDDAREVLGVNDPQQLAEVEAILAERERHA